MSAIFCGANAKLSFEHVLPEAAFNDHESSNPTGAAELPLRPQSPALPCRASQVKPGKNFIVFRGVNNSTAVRTTRTGGPNRCRFRGNGARPLSSPRAVTSRRQEIRATSQKPNTGGRYDHENTKR